MAENLANCSMPIGDAPPRVPPLPRPVKAAAAAICALAPVSTAAAACPSTETASAREIGSQINATRAASGVAPLKGSLMLLRTARAHSAAMASTRTLWHDPLRWARRRSAGQNVGIGVTAQQVFTAFMASPPHRAAILNRRFSRMGVSAARSCSGTLLVTVNFMS